MKLACRHPEPSVSLAKDLARSERSSEIHARSFADLRLLRGCDFFNAGEDFFVFSSAKQVMNEA